MQLLITYDVATSSEGGAKRLRKVAKLCEAHGQRVQKSVFECKLTVAQKEQFLHRLQKLIDEEEDSLRVYRLRQPRAENVEVFGKSLVLDLNEPLLI